MHVARQQKLPSSDFSKLPHGPAKAHHASCCVDYTPKIAVQSKTDVQYWGIQGILGTAIGSACKAVASNCLATLRSTWSRLSEDDLGAADGG